MSFLMFTGLAGMLASLLAIGVAVWAQRHDPEPITLLNILVVLGLCFCPIIQVFVIIAEIVYFFAEVAPKIILFGNKAPK